MYSSYLTPRRRAVSTYAARTKASAVYRGKPRWTAVRRTARQVMPLVAGPELKGVDTNLTLAPVITTDAGASNASSFTLNLITPGVASQNRVGRHVYLKSLRLKLFVMHQYSDVTTTSNVAANQLRAVVVWDKQPSGAVPTFETIFGLTQADGTEYARFTAPLRYDNTQRFKVVADEFLDARVIATSPEVGTENVVSQRYSIERFIKLRNLRTTFSGQSDPTTIADVSSGALYIFFRAQANLSGAGTNTLSIEDDSWARLRYTD